MLKTRLFPSFLFIFTSIHKVLWLQFFKVNNSTISNAEYLGCDCKASILTNSLHVKGIVHFWISGGLTSTYSSNINIFRNNANSITQILSLETKTAAILFTFAPVSELEKWRAKVHTQKRKTMENCIKSHKWSAKHRSILLPLKDFCAQDKRQTST